MVILIVMRTYELTIVLPGKATAAKKKTTQAKVEKAIAALKGKAGKVDDWGKRELAYPIAKNETGIFLHYQLELEPESAKNLDSKLNLEENVIRYLLVKKNG